MRCKDDYRLGCKNLVPQPLERWQAELVEDGEGLECPECHAITYWGEDQALKDAESGAARERLLDWQYELNHPEDF